MKDLRTEVSQLKDMVAKLEGQLNMHATHPYPTYYYPSYTSPYTTWTVPCTYGITTGAGG